MSPALTPYHARYYALELRRRGTPSDVAAIGTALFDARVDLNPHQVEAALFALRGLRERERSAPGRILADEVGLGKTIEAGLVLCQLWAERKRRLLVLAPAALRKQWVMELEEKFGLPARIAEGRGEADRFGGRGVTVASYSYAARRLEALGAEDWDLVVCDEAHRLRSAHDPASKQARPLAQALRRAPKVLLTATPLQNSLVELYGLCSVVDDRIFGDFLGFKARFLKGRPDFAALRERLAPVMLRTLRKEVLPYIRYTERHALTCRFRAPPRERAVYEAVSRFLSREDLVALPASQRALVTMAVRKLLASSSAAVAGVLHTLRRRVERIAAQETPPPIEAELADEGLDEAWLDSLLGEEEPPARGGDPRKEAAELAELAAMAEGIPVDQRAVRLVSALKEGFGRLRERGAPEKAVIFTESRRTQAMLFRHLQDHGFAGQVACFHGGGADEDTRPILDRWLASHPEAAAASRGANLRAAVVDHFAREARILIATEAGAEGLNLQFCAMVVNYDLPWNPQRVEQRIGRCHRYGQKHDVVVLNLLEETNAAEGRVFELLDEKFRLFDGIFGASDAIVGTLESGVGFERRIHRIFDVCRTDEQIAAAFAALRAELEHDVSAREERARRALLEHFDADVHERLRVPEGEAQARMNRMEALFWSLTRWALGDAARFDDGRLAFDLHAPSAGAPPGRYERVRRTGNRVPEAFVYRLTHPLGERVLARGAAAATPAAHLVFDGSSYGRRLSPVDALRGRTGWLRLDRIRIAGFADEEHLLLSGTVAPEGTVDPETLSRMFLLSAEVRPPRPGPPPELEEAARHAITATSTAAASRSLADFEAARDRLYRWAEDQILAAEEAVKDLRKQERELDRQARSAPTLEEKRALLRRLEDVETRKVRARHHLNTVEDDVRTRRAAHLDELERRIALRTEVDCVFTVSWEVV